MNIKTAIRWGKAFFNNIISNMKLQGKKNSLLLSPLFMTLVLLLVFYPQQVLSGLTLNVLEENKDLQVSIDKETNSKSLPAFKQKDAEEKKQRIKSKNTNKFTLLDYTGFAPSGLNSLPVRIILVVIIVFLALLYFLRRPEHKISISVNKDGALPPPPLNFIIIRFTINNFPEPEPEPEMIQPKRAKNRVALLENVFENEDYFSETGFIKEKKEHAQDKEQINEDTTSSGFLDSVDEIKYINEVTRFSKIDAFLKMTQSDDESSAGTVSIEGLLENELTNIQFDEKVDVFIEEFDLLISSLSQQTIILDKEPDELENLIQFKLSIHLIKVLSDMMQANYLKQFSQTIIEFLEEIVDGKAKMTVDILRRLHNVVNFCDQYINFLKNSHPVNIQM